MGPAPLHLKPFLKRVFPNSWVFISLVTIILAVPRFVIMLKGQYNPVIVIFTIMALTPFIVLTKEGRKSIGMVKPKLISLHLFYFITGLGSAYVVYLVGYWLYDHSSLHWYTVVMNTFNKGNMIREVRPHIWLFLLISLPTMIFSPIGEEIFFRGMVQDAFAEKFGYKVATVIESSFFGITHLAHYGIVLSATGWMILPSSIIWIGLMIMISVLFSFVRQKSGSIWGAVVCHAGFNLGMMACIFYVMN